MLRYEYNIIINEGLGAHYEETTKDTVNRLSDPGYPFTSTDFRLGVASIVESAIAGTEYSRNNWMGATEASDIVVGSQSPFDS